MYYVIDTSNNTVIAALTTVEGYQLGDGYIIREADLGSDVTSLVYDPETDTVRVLTDEERLALLKEAKLTELKAQIQTEFSELGDIIADIVKALKLILKYIMTDDESTRLALKDFLELELRYLEGLYPDDYSRTCVANYTNELVTKLPKYYQAKMAVLAATTPEEVEAVTLEFE